MKIKYAIFPDERLLIQRFIGLFVLEEYGAYMSRLMRNRDAQKTRKILIDFRDTKFDAELEIFNAKIEKMVSARKKLNDMMADTESVIRVFLVDSPLPTVAAHFFTERFPDQPYHYCSTPETAAKTLQLSPKYQDLEQLMAAL